MKFRTKSQSGFSLVEVMIATTISVFILASSYATIFALSKGTQSMINFSEMNSQTRVALETFGRDARMASWVIKKELNTFRIEREFKGETIEVQYDYVPNAKIFQRTVFDTANPSGVKDTLLFDVEEINFYYYTARQNTAGSLVDTKHVQLEAKLERKVLSITNTNYIISARFMMRNKHVAH